MTLRRTATAFSLALVLIGCGSDSTASQAATEQTAPDPIDPNFRITPVAELDYPWAMTFLPDGRMLVTEKTGALRIVTQAGKVSAPVAGVPKVAYAGQGGMGDVVLHPRFAENGLVYLSYAEPGGRDMQGAAVARAKLVEAGGAARLEGLEVIWRQDPKLHGTGHYSHRIAFAPDGHLFISSGERQEFSPAQDMKQNLGKIIRLTDDGKAPADNPFQGKGAITAQIWSLGHRNPLGLAFDASGRLWETEMGPRGGDELNLIEKGVNYGYPIVSEGDNYDGTPIPRHATRPQFRAPLIAWNPVISPANLMIYTGDLFPAWKGSAIIGGLSGYMVRASLGDAPREVERFTMNMRIREVEQGPDGAVWLLEDELEGQGGRLLKLTPS